MVQVKVIDFGSSCFVDDCLTNYVQSRSYRLDDPKRVSMGNGGKYLPTITIYYIYHRNQIFMYIRIYIYMYISVPWMVWMMGLVQKWVWMMGMVQKWARRVLKSTFWGDDWDDLVKPAGNSAINRDDGMMVSSVSSIFFYVHPETWGRWTHFDSYVSKGLVQPPTRYGLGIRVQVSCCGYQALMALINPGLSESF